MAILIEQQGLPTHETRGKEVLEKAPSSTKEISFTGFDLSSTFGKLQAKRQEVLLGIANGRIGGLIGKKNMVLMKFLLS